MNASLMGTALVLYHGRFPAETTIGERQFRLFCSKSKPFQAPLMSTLIRTLSSMNTSMTCKTRRLYCINNEPATSFFGIQHSHLRIVSHNQCVGIDEASHQCGFEYERWEHFFVWSFYHNLGSYTSMGAHSYGFDNVSEDLISDWSSVN